MALFASSRPILLCREFELFFAIDSNLFASSFAWASALANSLAFSTVIGGFGGGTLARSDDPSRRLSLVEGAGCVGIGVRGVDLVVTDGLTAVDDLVADADVDVDAALTVADGLGVVAELRAILSLIAS